MTITARIVADSIHKDNRITTVELRYPYIIHAQLLTHRVFSRNSQSNRAIPVKKMIQKTLSDPYNPVFRANKPGMVAGEEVSQFIPSLVWSLARKAAIWAAKTMDLCGVHKETTNRLLLPFMHVTTVVTSTEWDNFFALRIEDSAQPEIQMLAQAIKNAIDFSTPEPIGYGEWHLPYVTEKTHPEALKLSVARCARVSYLNHDNSNPSITKDIELYHDLVTSKPVHGSPAEHQATPLGTGSKGLTHVDMDCNRWSNNLRGWAQYRAIIEE